MSEYFKMLCHATVDEEGNVSGGVSGDQTGFELNMCNWYSRPWIAIYRPLNNEWKDKIADFMIDAVSNGWLGYSSTRTVRQKFFDKCKENNFNVKSINESLGCDCSSLLFTALNTVWDLYDINVTYYDEKNDKQLNIPLARHYPDLLDSSGLFQKFTTVDYLTSPNNLQRGDILVANSHVSVWV